MYNLKTNIIVIIAIFRKIFLIFILLILPNTLIAKDSFVEWRKRNFQEDLIRGGQGKYPVKPISKKNNKSKPKNKSANKKIANKKLSQSKPNQQASTKGYQSQPSEQSSKQANAKGSQSDQSGQSKPNQQANAKGYQSDQPGQSKPNQPRQSKSNQQANAKGYQSNQPRQSKSNQQANAKGSQSDQPGQSKSNQQANAKGYQSDQPSQNSRQAKVGNYQPNKSFNQSNKQKLSNKNSNKAIQNKNFGLYFDLAFDSNIAAKDIKKIDFNNNFNTVIMFEFKSEYLELRQIEGVELFNNNNLIYNINLGLELGSKYLGYVGAGYDKLLANKMPIDVYKIINNSDNFLNDYYFLKTYYKTPSIFGFTLYGEAAINDSKTSQYTKYFSNKNTLSIVDNIAKTNILETQNLNNAKYFNYKSFSDKETAYIIDFGINYKLDIGTKTKQNNSFHLEMDVSAILARVKPEISTQILEDMQDFLNISKQDFDNIRNDKIMKINSGFAMQWNMNTLLLDSINISGGYSFVQKFLYSAADQFGIINDSMVDSLSNYKFNDSDFKPNLYRMIYELNDKLNLAFANSNSHIKQGIAFLDVTTKIQQSLGGAEGLINQMTLEQLVGFQGSQIAAQDAYARGEIIICQSGQSYCAAYEATLFIADYSAVFFNYSTDPFLLSTVAEYKKQSKLYERYLVYQPTFDKIDIKKYSNTMHHIVNGSIKLEKFGLFISTSANYMMGEQAIYKNNGLFDSAEFIKYSVMRVGASVGYEFKDLIVASDSLNLYINGHYNSKEFIDKDSEYVFGMGIRYDL